MGKVTGFLEIDRQDRKYAPASDRIRHYKEFVLPVSEATIKDQASRCMNCGIPFCHNGCPVNNQIPDWNDLVYQEDWEEALRNLHSTNNFPEFTAASARALRGGLHAEHRGYACHHQVDRMRDHRQGLGHGLGRPRAAEGEDRQERRHRRLRPRRPRRGAQQLARAGHDVHLYEKNARAGGLLRYGIPDFKMEKRHVDRRVQQMEAEGVTFHYGVNVGAST